MERTALVPTFAFGRWCEEGAFDPKRDPTELGMLNEHLRKDAVGTTLTPCFRVAIMSLAGPVPPLLDVDPFGPGSLQAWLGYRRATVVAYGARLCDASDFHLAERHVGVPYRYMKPFRGRLSGVDFTLRYFVRPMEGVEYDLDRLDEILTPCFTAHETEAGTVRVGRSDRIFRTLVEALEADEHALLKRPPRELYERHGKPLRYERVEAVA